MWNEHNCTVVWTFFVTALLWNWNENWPFPVLWPLLSFPILQAYWVQLFILFMGSSVLNIHWKDWCWSWNSSTLATWCEELTHWKRPWWWERLKAGEGDNRRWDGWMASPTWWASSKSWVWATSGSWWWTGRPGMLQSMGSQRIRGNRTELNW